MIMNTNYVNMNISQMPHFIQNKDLFLTKTFNHNVLQYNNILPIMFNVCQLCVKHSFKNWLQHEPDSIA